MQKSKPINIVIVAFFLFVWGILSIPIGVLSFAFVPFASDDGRALADAYILLVLGIAHLVAAYGLWTRQDWSRRFTFLILLISILLTPMYIEDDTNKLEIDALIIGCVLNAVMILLIWNKKVGEWLESAGQ
jgi:peptidoglycan/LPS O-acetylase OafA/YrhL